MMMGEAEGEELLTGEAGGRSAQELCAAGVAGKHGHLQTIFEVVQARSRLKITSELGKFIEVDNQEVVKIGDLKRCTEVIKICLAQFHQADLPERGRPRRGRRTGAPR